MQTVSDEVKNKLKSDDCEKKFLVFINGASVDEDYIYKNSFSLTEQIMSDTLEMTGCIASTCKLTINSASGRAVANGYALQITMQVKLADGTWSNQIYLFKGFIDTAELSSDKRSMEITAYDALYYIGSLNIYNWYNNKVTGYPSWGNAKSITLKTFRDRLFNYVSSLGYNLSQAIAELPNDTLKIKKRFKNKDLTLIDVLKGLCQINGCFGIVGRTGLFEYRYISKYDGGEPIGAYPGLAHAGEVYASQPLSTQSSEDGETQPDIISEYESLEYGHTLVNPVLNGITMRNNSDDAGVTWSSEQGASIDWDDDTTDDALIDDETAIIGSTYILDGNMFAYKIKRANKKKAIANIYAQIGKDTYFRNYEAKHNGLPYLECCDKVIYVKPDGYQIEMIITKRTLSGDQFLRDVFVTECADKLPEYVSTSQSVTNSTSVSVDEVQDITNSTLEGNGGTGEAPNNGYMYVVSWDPSTGVLETNSGANNG